MTRHVFYRDFSLCKAALLLALMGMAVVAGKDADRFAASASQGQADPHQVVPAAAEADKSECPVWKGVAL